MNGLMWTAIGTKITVTGISSYLKLGETDALWWMIPLSLLVFAGFYWMFTGVVRKYAAREGAATVDLSALPKGTYVVKDGKRTYKIMKR